MDSLSNISFTGQQEGEKILSVVKPHPLAFVVEYAILIFVSLLLLVGFVSLKEINSIFVTIGTVSSMIVLIIGLIVFHFLNPRRIAYITDRRIIRFEPSNIFVINSRSLTWENVLKVKTFSTSLLWRLFKIGNAIVHSKTTATSINDPNQVLVGNDDIILKKVHFYKDLGNYIDKILYIYSHNPNELGEIRPFVAKVKGKRY